MKVAVEDQGGGQDEQSQRRGIGEPHIEERRELGGRGRRGRVVAPELNKHGVSDVLVKRAVEIGRKRDCAQKVAGRVVLVGSMTTSFARRQMNRNGAPAASCEIARDV